MTKRTPSVPASKSYHPVANRKRGDGRIVRKTAVELVVEAIRARILSGHLKPGAALRQEALSEELGVSRIPLREAMRQLSVEGLVELIPHRGAFVSMLSMEEVREFFDLRLRLEPWLVRESAMRIAGSDLDDAERIVQRMDAVDPAEWGNLNWELHHLLYRAAERPAALAIVHTLHEKTERYFRLQVVNAPIRQQSHDEHMALILHCRNREAAKAEDALVRHIAGAADQILNIIEQLLGETTTDGSE